jgi:hypothetical protein
MTHRCGVIYLHPVYPFVQYGKNTNRHRLFNELRTLLLMEFGIQGQFSGKFPDRLWDPASLPSKRYGELSPGVKCPGREADH